MPPICFNGSPRDIVRFQYLMEGSELSARCFCRLVAMARPMEPKPNHPSRMVSAPDMLKMVSCIFRFSVGDGTLKTLQVEGKTKFDRAKYTSH
jgi:hypothetical protein